MKVSVVVIAHNEEGHIGACLMSLLSQTLKADEIVVINHNSSDSTGKVARQYRVTVVDYEGPRGPAYARIRGFEVAQGEHVLCIDGDAVAAPNWIETLSNLLNQDRMVMVGSWIRMTGTLYASVGSLRWYLTCPSKGVRATDYLWGASYGIQGRDKEIAIRALQQGKELSDELELAYNPDDYWLALFMQKRGEVQVTNKTSVLAHAKETNDWQSFVRGIVATGIRLKIQSFLKKNGLPNLT
jgi:glycosyltransferase involved in cell wall biosynthesis